MFSLSVHEKSCGHIILFIKPLVPSIFIYDHRERKLFQNDGHDANFLCDNDVKSKTKRKLISQL